ncbi:WhiB family transcriptional regulator [Streptomyces sp. EN23]|uniref:WhiB family transcriptional regulator n=1 Tax=Streptomyces sp. EN23 TaxID=212774 RepID=UPI000851CE7D|nr:WhiB family transcriptional regulator [Streptomyces sp. EN23]
MSTTLFKVTRSHTAPDTLGRAVDWRTLGNCSTAPNDDLWFPEATDKATARAAITVCLSCPVLLLCRQAAADEERGDGKQSRYGIRGGLTPVQRWVADSHTQAGKGKGGRRLAPCGTNAAYDRHVRSGEQPCDPCRRAHNERNVQVRAEARHRQAAAACGTRGGYQKHRRNGEAACTPCRQANADADRRLRNTGTTTERSAA